jgi:hypothetical protein
MTTVRLLLCLYLAVSLLSAADQLAAQDQPGQRPLRISLDLAEDRGGRSPAMTKLFRDTLLLEFRLAGLSFSDSSEADVRVTGDYEVAGGEIRYSMRAAVTDGEVLFSVEAGENLGLALDTVLLRQAERLAAAVLAYRDSMEQFSVSGPDERENAPAEEGDSIAQTESLSAESVTSEAVATEPVPAETVIAGGVIPAERTAEGSRLVFAADVGLFLAAGEAGRYLKTGYSPSFFAGYAYRPGLSLGLMTNVLLFRAEGYAAEANGFILSASPELRLMPANSGPLKTGFRGGVGAALFSVTGGDGEARTKIIPAAEAGMVIEVPAGRLLLQLFLDYTLYYENSSLLYGFSPRVGLGL